MQERRQADTKGGQGVPRLEDFPFMEFHPFQPQCLFAFIPGPASGTGVRLNGGCFSATTVAAEDVVSVRGITATRSHVVHGLELAVSCLIRGRLQAPDPGLGEPNQVFEDVPARSGCPCKRSFSVPGHRGVVQRLLDRRMISPPRIPHDLNFFL